MLDKRLFKIAPKSKEWVAKVVLFNWMSLIFNIGLIFSIGYVIDNGIQVWLLIIQISFLVLKILMSSKSRRYSVESSNYAKTKIRDVLYHKMIDLGNKSTSYLNTATLTQLMGEGVDQLEMYFGNYMPQFFYAILAPLTLFLVLIGLNFKVSLVLLILVPVIPVSIIVVQKIAKRILDKYWDSYIVLGNSFLDNIQGLTTLKLYNADEKMHEKMNEESETFRKATMRLLVMQLNSISVMDLVAYGGAALAMVITYNEYVKGSFSLGVAVVFVLISSEFFIPMRQLGSYFHVAMNGLSAADRMFEFLESDKEVEALEKLDLSFDLVEVKNLSFMYEQKKVLDDLSFKMSVGQFVGIVGESGSGKSTLLKILSKTLDTNAVFVDGVNLSRIDHIYFREHVVLVSDKSTVFKGSIRSNLEISGVRDEKTLQDICKLVRLQGLDRKVDERGSNLSGGEKQRLILARALLFDAKVYLLDEITSNIDVESEKIIMEVVSNMKNKLVVMVSHRLENVVDADQIIVLDEGSLVGKGLHINLMNVCAPYRSLYTTQKQLENFMVGEHDA